MKIRNKLSRLAGCVLAGLSFVVPAVGDLSPVAQEPLLEQELVKSKESDLYPNEQARREIEALARFGAGVTYELTLNSARALEEFYKAAMADPSNNTLLLDVVRKLIRENELEKARALLTEAAKLDSTPSEVHGMLAFLESRAGNFDAAVKAGRAAIDKAPTSLQPYQYLGQILLEAEKYADAYQVLDEASQHVAGTPRNLLMVAELLLNLRENDASQSEKITKRVEDLVKRAGPQAKDDKNLLEMLAFTYRRLGMYDQAIALYESLKTSSPEALDLREKLGDTYMQAGNLAAAKAEFQAILLQRPDYVRAHLLLYQMAVDEKDYPTAAEHLESTVKLRPEAEAMYYQLARLQVFLDQDDKALETLGRARARFNAGFEVEYTTALVYNRRQDFAKASKYFTKAEIQAGATDPAQLTAGFYFEAGATAERNKDYKEAENYFRKSLKLEPERVETLNYLGYMWAEQGTNLKEAREMIEKALALEPENAAYLDSMAWVLYKLKESAKALEYQKKAIALTEEEDPILFDHLGDIHAALDQMDQARQAWQKSLKLEASDTVKAKLDAVPAAKD